MKPYARCSGRKFGRQPGGFPREESTLNQEVTLLLDKKAAIRQVWKRLDIIRPDQSTSTHSLGVCTNKRAHRKGTVA